MVGPQLGDGVWVENTLKYTILTFFWAPFDGHFSKLTFETKH